MADANEVDEGHKVEEVPKLNSSPGEDKPQSDIAPSSISNVEEEEDEDEDEDEDELEDEGESEEDEEEQEEEEGEEDEESEEEGEKEKVNDGGSAILVVNGEIANTDKEQNKANVVKKDENKGGETKNGNKVGETKNGEELGENSKRKDKRARPRNRNKKKDAQKASGTLAVVEDKPESSSKKKASKRVECMGMVFMCSSKTKTDCFRYNVLGLPGNKKDQVAKIYKGMRLFLFDVDLRLMYGIFKAAAPGGYNLEPKAFNSEFPSQVRFRVLEDCLPVAEEKFKEVLKKNYYSRNKFEGLLKAEQVKDLCKLFVGARRGPRPKAAAKPPRSRAVESRRVRRDESRRVRADDAHISRPREKRKRRTREEERRPREEERRPREEERRPRSPPRREKRRHTDYERPPVLYEHEAPVRYEREAPVRYEREPPVLYEREPPVLYEREAPVARYLPPPRASPVRYYERPLDMAPYVRDRAPEHHTYRVIDVDLSRDRERERDPYQVYGREPAPYYTLPPEYVVPRDYRPPVVQAAEYRLSGGSSSLGTYRDVELATTDYRSSAPSLPEYRSRTHYRY